MTDERGARLAALREAFDAQFASAPAPSGGAKDEYLAVRIGGDPYALPIAQAAALLRSPAVARLPGAGASLLGVTGVRGAPVLVFDIGVLLGYGPAAREVEGWVAVSRAMPSVAFALTAVEGYCDGGKLVAAGSTEAGACGATLVDATGARPVLDLDVLAKRAAGGGS